MTLRSPRRSKIIPLTCRGMALAMAIGLSACAADRPPPDPSPAPQAAEAPALWGDRTVAMTYKGGDPLVAYFSAGEGTGRISVWDGGESAIVKGGWRREGRRVCMDLSVFRRDETPAPPLRARAPVCLDEGDQRLSSRSWRGDVFGLALMTEAPYILSQADNERLVTQLHDAEKVAR